MAELKLLEDRIREEGEIIGDDIVKVDMFLNHLIDIELLCAIGKEFRNLFAGEKINKILTIEASGIGIACIAAQYFNVPVVLPKRASTETSAAIFIRVRFFHSPRIKRRR